MRAPNGRNSTQENHHQTANRPKRFVYFFWHNMLLAHGSLKKTNPTIASTGNSGLLEFFNTCTCYVCFLEISRNYVGFLSNSQQAWYQLPETLAWEGISSCAHQLSPATTQIENGNTTSHSELSVPTILQVQSLLKWPGWLNAHVWTLESNEDQGYLQPPQHSCGDTAVSVAVGPLCNFTSSQTQQEVRAKSSVSPATLIISVQ